MFSVKYSYNSCFLKRIIAREIAVLSDLEDADLKHNTLRKKKNHVLIWPFLHFIRSAFTDLAFEILKMLVKCLRFRDAL